MQPFKIFPFWQASKKKFNPVMFSTKLNQPSGADGVRHRPRGRVVRGVHGRFRSRDTTAVAHSQRAAQP